MLVRPRRPASLLVEVISAVEVWRRRMYPPSAVQCEFRHGTLTDSAPVERRKVGVAGGTSHRGEHPGNPGAKSFKATSVLDEPRSGLIGEPARYDATKCAGPCLSAKIPQKHSHARSLHSCYRERPGHKVASTIRRNGSRFRI